MGTGKDNSWAAQYVLDPLTAPEPHQETGPGSHFVPPPPSTTSKSSVSNNLPTPPHSASPSRSSFHPSNPYSPIMSSHRQEAFGGLNEGYQKPPSGNPRDGETKTRRRGSSLGQRYPGDDTHKPLEILRKESKKAQRAPHLRKNHLPPADPIDALDFSSGGVHYHHGGPYDAVLAARNTSWKNSPIEALRDSTEEALKATPRENVMDSIKKHVPLQGTATIPPGMTDFAGREMHYEEGADLMRDPDQDGGAYKRWPGMQYAPDDLKGKGEPAYTIEKDLKQLKLHNAETTYNDNGYEMRSQSSRTRQRAVSHADQKGGYVLASSQDNDEGSVRRRNTTGRGVGEGLKKRFGSIRRKKVATEP